MSVSWFQDGTFSSREAQSTGVPMANTIETEFQRAAIVLSASEDYTAAADELGIAVAELQERIRTLEARLCVQLFRPISSERVTLTQDGQIIVEVFREMVARWNKNRASGVQSR